jgi:hypothetical protein
MLEKVRVYHAGQKYGGFQEAMHCTKRDVYREAALLLGGFFIQEIRQ